MYSIRHPVGFIIWGISSAIFPAWGRSTTTFCWQALNSLTMPMYILMYGLQTPLLVHSSIKIVKVNAILEIHRCAYSSELALMESSWMSQLVVSSFHYLIFSHLYVNMPNGTLCVSSHARRSIHVSARRIQVYCQAMMSMSDPDVPALCLITVNN